MKRNTYVCLLLVALYGSSCKTLKISNDAPLDHIVLVTGDTLYGKMAYFKETFTGPEYHKKVRFRDTTGKKKRFKWEKLKAYRFNGSDYVGFKLTRRKQSFGQGNLTEVRYYLNPNGNTNFIKVKELGPLSHYQFEWIDQGIDNGDAIVGQPSWARQDVLKKADDDFFLNAEGSVLFGLPRKSLSHYLSDCPEIQEKLMQKDVKYAFEIVDFYNKHCE
ncbi:hypothetical protein [Maribacter sp. 2307ULW6-5]|uniref:hypothetical protein n=1 Tax=Maribacter sp. 2307ULW6-5 TaxID=3386275 RepID=UPI0039BD5DFC